MVTARIRLRHLRAFLEVAQLGGVGVAADSLSITQPAVTRTIRELEDLLGVALLAREGRGVRLTLEGEIFRRHAAMALAAVRQGVDAVAAGAAEDAPIRLGALPTVSARIMPRALRAALDGSPSVRVQIATGENAVLLEQLRLGQLDLMIGRLALPEKMTGLVFEHLYSEKVVFAVRPGHPVLADPNPLGRLETALLLMPPRSAIIRPSVDRFLISRGVSAAAPRIETVSDSFGRGFARETDAVWIISEGVVAQDMADGALVALPIDTDETRGPVGLTRRAEAETDAGMALVMRCIRAVAATATRPPAPLPRDKGGRHL